MTRKGIGQETNVLKYKLTVGTVNVEVYLNMLSRHHA